MMICLHAFQVASQRGKSATEFLGSVNAKQGQDDAGLCQRFAKLRDASKCMIMDMYLAKFVPCFCTDRPFYIIGMIGKQPGTRLLEVLIQGCLVHQRWTVYERTQSCRTR